jgi:putative transposase
MNKPVFDISKVEEKLKNIKSLSDITGQDGLLQEIFKNTIERILKAEQEVHLGFEPNTKEPKKTDNRRNGYSKKTIKTTSGAVEIEVPRDRDGSFEPQIIAKHQSFDPDLEARVRSLYAKGVTVRDICSHLSEFYKTEVSPTLISKVTDRILEGVATWQSRPLEKVYAVVFMDAIFFKVRHDHKVISKAAYSCVGIDLEGQSDILGSWIAETEGAHFWMGVLSELQARGVEDILIACVDGLKGFPEAIEGIFPKTQVQLCIIHQIRNSLKYVGSKHQREFMMDLKLVYKAPSLAIAESNLEKVSEKWSEKYPIVISSWKNNWTHLSTFFQFPELIRRMIYTTNSVENLHRQLRKVTHNKSQFPSDDALTKMIYLATMEIQKKMKTKQHWGQMIGQLKIIFGDRVQLALKI